MVSNLDFLPLSILQCHEANSRILDLWLLVKDYTTIVIQGETEGGVEREIPEPMERYHEMLTNKQNTQHSASECLGLNPGSCCWVQLPGSAHLGRQCCCRGMTELRFHFVALALTSFSPGLLRHLGEYALFSHPSPTCVKKKKKKITKTKLPVNTWHKIKYQILLLYTYYLDQV